MSETPEIPYEAFYDVNGQPTNQTTWTPPPPEPESDVFDRHIASVRELKELLHPTPKPERDEYPDFFPEGA